LDCCSIISQQSAHSKRNNNAGPHLAVKYPSCPEDQIPFLLQKFTAREWENATLPKAAGIVATDHIRNTLPIHEALLKRYKLSRRQVRLLVSDEVNAKTAAWRKGTPMRRLRKAKKRRKDKLANYATDNASVRRALKEMRYQARSCPLHGPHKGSSVQTITPHQNKITKAPLNPINSPQRTSDLAKTF
jgi:hypothetical protein